MENKKTSHSREKKPHKNGENSLDALIHEASKIEKATEITVTEAETEFAFQSVAQNSGLQLKQKKPMQIAWIRYTAAAVILLGIIAAWYLLTPQKITASAEAVRVIHMPDQTTIILNNGSTLTYPRWFGWWSRSVSLNGQAFFNVTKTGEPFTVETKNAQITVLGTKFSVQTRAEQGQTETTVFLREGKISFAPKNRRAEAVILKPGQQSWLSEQYSTPVKPHKVDSSKALAWLQKGLSFENEPLSVIFEALSLRFDIEIKTKSVQILTERLTIYISNPKGIEQTLRDICSAKGLQFTRKNDTFIISYK